MITKTQTLPAMNFRNVSTLFTVKFPQKSGGNKALPHNFRVQNPTVSSLIEKAMNNNLYETECMLC